MSAVDHAANQAALRQIYESGLGRDGIKPVGTYSTDERDMFVFVVGSDGRVYGAGDPMPPGVTTAKLLEITIWDEDGKALVNAQVIEPRQAGLEVTGAADSGSGDPVGSATYTEDKFLRNERGEPTRKLTDFELDMNRIRRWSLYTPTDPKVGLRQALVDLIESGTLYDATATPIERAVKASGSQGRIPIVVGVAVLGVVLVAFLANGSIVPVSAPSSPGAGTTSTLPTSPATSIGGGPGAGPVDCHAPPTVCFQAGVGSFGITDPGTGKTTDAVLECTGFLTYADAVKGSVTRGTVKMEGQLSVTTGTTAAYPFAIRNGVDDEATKALLEKHAKSLNVAYQPTASDAFAFAVEVAPPSAGGTIAFTCTVTNVTADSAGVVIAINQPDFVLPVSMSATWR